MALDKSMKTRWKETYRPMICMSNTRR